MPHATIVMRRTLIVASLLLAACATASARPGGTRQSTAAASAPIVIGESFTLPARALGGEVRHINVWTPPVYAATADRRLPVLYMPDGGMEEDFLHVAGLLQVSIGNGTMRPFILVGIENTQRRRDLTGPTSIARDSAIAPRVGSSAAFRAFVRDELIPEVDRRYRTTGERAIVGESLAGLFVVETFLLEPALFDTYIAFDPSLWWDAARLVHASGAQLRARPAARQSLYLASSVEPDIATLTRELADTLAAVRPAGLRWHLEPMPEEQHSTIYHPAALRAFRAVFAPADSAR